MPGSIYSPSSELTNRLIQDGAKLVLNYNDVLEELNLSSVAHQIGMRLAPDLPEIATDDEEKSCWRIWEMNPCTLTTLLGAPAYPSPRLAGCSLCRK